MLEPQTDVIYNDTLAECGLQSKTIVTPICLVNLSAYDVFAKNIADNSIIVQVI